MGQSLFFFLLLEGVVENDGHDHSQSYDAQNYPEDDDVALAAGVVAKRFGAAGL